MISVMSHLRSVVFGSFHSSNVTRLLSSSGHLLILPVDQAPTADFFCELFFSQLQPGNECPIISLCNYLRSLYCPHPLQSETIRFTCSLILHTSTSPLLHLSMVFPRFPLFFADDPAAWQLKVRFLFTPQLSKVYLKGKPSEIIPAAHHQPPIWEYISFSAPKG